MFGDLLQTTRHALNLVFDEVTHVNVPLLLLGVLLHVASQMVRTRGWHTILKASYPESPTFTANHTMRAYLAGSGINSVVPARGGDVVKLWLLHRRIPGARYPTLAATFVPETIFETLFGSLLVAWALYMGFLPVPTTSGDLPQFDVSFALSHPVWASVIVVALAAVIYVVVRWLRGQVVDLAARLRQGVAILGTPRRFVTGVASWQLLSRIIRLLSLAALMGAFKLPVTVTTVVLVMAAQGGGRIIPVAPASNGLRLIMLSYGFVEVTGQRVDIAAITAFTVGVGLALMVTGLLVGLVSLAIELETRSPGQAIRQAREQIARRRMAKGPT
jgi:uncharacterized membrane protein YbhN (UPF0104 family)